MHVDHQFTDPAEKRTWLRRVAPNLHRTSNRSARESQRLLRVRYHTVFVKMRREERDKCEALPYLAFRSSPAFLAATSLLIRSGFKTRAEARHLSRSMKRLSCSCIMSRPSFNCSRKELPLILHPLPYWSPRTAFVPSSSSHNGLAMWLPSCYCTSSRCPIEFRRISTFAVPERGNLSSSDGIFSMFFVLLVGDVFICVSRIE